MRTISAANLTSREGSGDLVIPANRDRSYFFLVMTSTSGTVSFGADDAGEIPLANGTHYEPYVTTTGQINITTTGTYTYVLG